MLATPAVHDAESAARRDGKVRVGIGIERSELDAGGAARQREPHRRGELPALAVKDEQLRTLGRVHADRHVRVPVDPSEFTGGYSRDATRQWNPLRLAHPPPAVARP